MGDIGVDGRKFDNIVDSFRGIFRGVDLGVWIFIEEDVIEIMDVGLKKFCEKMSVFELYEYWVLNGIFLLYLNSC